MLVLTRKCGEEIVIDGNIRVQVLKVQGNRVRIGIETPTGVRILRAELAPAQKATQNAEYAWAM